MCEFLTLHGAALCFRLIRLSVLLPLSELREKRIWSGMIPTRASLRSNSTFLEGMHRSKRQKNQSQHPSPLQQAARFTLFTCAVLGHQPFRERKKVGKKTIATRKPAFSWGFRMFGTIRHECHSKKKKEKKRKTRCGIDWLCRFFLVYSTLSWKGWPSCFRC